MSKKSPSPFLHPPTGGKGEGTGYAWQHVFDNLAVSHLVSSQAYQENFQLSDKFIFVFLKTFLCLSELKI